MRIQPIQIAKTERCTRLYKDVGYLIDKYMPTGQYALKMNLGSELVLGDIPIRGGWTRTVSLMLEQQEVELEDR